MKKQAWNDYISGFTELKDLEIPGPEGNLVKLKHNIVSEISIEKIWRDWMLRIPIYRQYKNGNILKEDLFIIDGRNIKLITLDYLYQEIFPTTSHFDANGGKPFLFYQLYIGQNPKPDFYIHTEEVWYFYELLSIKITILKTSHLLSVHHLIEDTKNWLQNFLNN